MKPRILVVEDDPISLDIMRSTLESHGYQVDSATDGMAGLERLKRQSYDVALLDFNLPDIDGFSSAQMMHLMHDNGQCPKLFAVTANPGGLETRIGNSVSPFDGVLRKPFRPNALINLVETSLRGDSRPAMTIRADAIWRSYCLEGRPRAFAVPALKPEEALVLAVCFDIVNEPNCDIIITTTPNHCLGELRLQHGLAVVPLVYVGENCDDYADVRFRPAEPDTWRAVSDCIHRFRMRQSELVYSPYDKDQAIRLLAYTYLSQRPLIPLPDATKRSFVQYSGGFSEGDVISSAEQLVSRGLMRKRFVDRFNACGACGSHRLNVRLECPSCRSANLRQAQMIHHFKCGYQGIEAEFVDGSGLTCPKCQKQLRQFRTDYDRPAKVMQCCDCETTFPQAGSTFVCIDCSAHTAQEDHVSRDIFAYECTDDGAAFLRRPRSSAVYAIADSAFVAVDDAAIEAIEDIAAQSGAARNNLVVLEIGYGISPGSDFPASPSRFLDMRKLLIEHLTMVVGSTGAVIGGTINDYAVVNGEDRSRFANFYEILTKFCAHTIAEDVYPSMRWFSADRAVRRM